MTRVPPAVDGAAFQSPRMPLDDSPDDRQTETRAALCPARVARLERLCMRFGSTIAWP